MFANDKHDCHFCRIAKNVAAKLPLAEFRSGFAPLSAVSGSALLQ